MPSSNLGVVQQTQVRPELLADARDDLRDVLEVAGCRPARLARQRSIGRLVEELADAHYKVPAKLFASSTFSTSARTSGQSLVVMSSSAAESGTFEPGCCSTKVA